MHSADSPREASRERVSAGTGPLVAVTLLAIVGRGASAQADERQTSRVQATE